MHYEEHLRQAREMDDLDAKTAIRQAVGTPAFTGLLSLLLANREAAVNAAAASVANHAVLASHTGRYSQMDETLDQLRIIVNPTPEQLVEEAERREHRNRRQRV